MKRDFLPALVGIVVVLGLTFGLTAMKGEYPPVTRPAVGAIAAITGEATKGKPEGRVVMHVNGEPVTEREFQLFAMQAPPEMQQMLASPAIRRNLAERLAQMKALEQEGRKLGAERDPELRTRMQFVQGSLTAEYAIRKLVQEVAEPQVRAAYEKEKANFEGIELSHILIAYQGGAVPARNGNAPPVGEALAKAQSLARQLQANQVDFVSVARTESDDTQSGVMGGGLGTIGRSMLPPEMAAVVFALKPGQVSNPLRTEHGIHIFKAGNRVSRTYEQARAELAPRVEQEVLNKTMSRVKSETKVDLDPEYFPPVQQPGAPAQPPGTKSSS